MKQAHWFPCDPPKGIGPNSKRAFRIRRTDGRVQTRVVESDSARDGKLFLTRLFAQVKWHKLAGPVRIVILWGMPHLKKHPKGNRHAVWHVGYPDNTNFAKPIEDVLESLGVFESGDQQISETLILAMRSDTPGIGIIIEEQDPQSLADCATARDMFNVLAWGGCSSC